MCFLCGLLRIWSTQEHSEEGGALLPQLREATAGVLTGPPVNAFYEIYGAPPTGS